jgi:hypothetical protein
MANELGSTNNNLIQEKKIKIKIYWNSDIFYLSIIFAYQKNCVFKKLVISFLGEQKKMNS